MNDFDHMFQLIFTNSLVTYLLPCGCSFTKRLRLHMFCKYLKLTNAQQKLSAKPLLQSNHELEKKT